MRARENAPGATGRRTAAPAQPELWETGARALGTLRLVREGTFPAPAGYPACTPDARIPVRTPRDVFDLMAPYAAREVAETFWLLSLDAQHHVTEPIAVTRGTLNASLIHPREVFRAAIVLCHNHPSGDPTPSMDDRVVTDRLVAVGRLLDMPVHDHVIIGEGRYTSFAEAGLI